MGSRPKKHEILQVLTSQGGVPNTDLSSSNLFFLLCTVARGRDKRGLMARKLLMDAKKERKCR